MLCVPRYTEEEGKVTVYGAARARTANSSNQRADRFWLKARVEHTAIEQKKNLRAVVVSFLIAAAHGLPVCRTVPHGAPPPPPLNT